MCQFEIFLKIKEGALLDTDLAIFSLMTKASKYMLTWCKIWQILEQSLQNPNIHLISKYYWV